MGKEIMEKKTRCDGTMTEAQYWGRIRSILRSGSLRWTPLQKVLMQNRRPYKGSNPRQQWEYQCSMCNRWWPRKEIDRDHRDGCGSLSCEEDAGRFITNLFCDTEELRLLCKTCHGIVTYAASNDMSIEEATIEKRVINMLQDKNACDIIFSSNGYQKKDYSNQEKRRNVLRFLIKEGKI